MLIGNDWKVESDSLNVTLYRRRTIKATPEKPEHDAWSTEGYYATPQGALKSLLDMEVMETKLKDFKAVCQKQEELYRLIEKLK